MIVVIVEILSDSHWAFWWKKSLKSMSYALTVSQDWCLFGFGFIAKDGYKHKQLQKGIIMF